MNWWKEPTAGDVVWCHFPDHINPRPKPRPALILIVFDDDAPQFVVRVAYGTSQKTNTLFAGEFLISKTATPAAYEAANLSYNTKFDLSQSVDLPFIEDWFSVPPRAPWGQNPKMGILHPSMMRTLQAAACGSKKPNAL